MKLLSCLLGQVVEMEKWSKVKWKWTEGHDKHSQETVLEGIKKNVYLFYVMQILWMLKFFTLVTCYHILEWGTIIKECHNRYLVVVSCQVLE